MFELTAGSKVTGQTVMGCRDLFHDMPQMCSLADVLMHLVS